MKSGLMKQEIKTVTKNLLNLRSSEKERGVETALKNVLETIFSDIKWEQDQKTKSGHRLDLLSSSMRVLIECKEKGNVDPSKPNPNHLSQKGQVERYLRDMYNPMIDSQYPWHGFLTDGSLWWGWEYNYPEDNFKTIVHRKEINTDSQLVTFIEDTVVVKDRRKLKRWGTEDMLRHFQIRLLPKLEGIMKKSESKQEFITKKQLWRILLHGSGIIPEKEGLVLSEMFLIHSFIVSIARLIIVYLNDPKASNKKYKDQLSDGFQSWIIEARDGSSFLDDLIVEIKKFDWGKAEKDVLKEIYHELINPKYRKEFGEFYTPDWLAERMIDIVLDEEWMDDNIQRAMNPLHDEAEQSLGLLDPACGSGTFLFHAAKRLRNRIKQKHRIYEHKTAQIISRLIHGIDIHPIAVEMSRATLSMALPSPPPPIWVKIGSSTSNTG